MMAAALRRRHHRRRIRGRHHLPQSPVLRALIRAAEDPVAFPVAAALLVLVTCCCCMVGFCWGARIDTAEQGTGSPCYELDAAGKEDLTRPQVIISGPTIRHRCT